MKLLGRIDDKVTDSEDLHGSTADGWGAKKLGTVWKDFGTFSDIDSFCDPHLDLFKVVDLEISCLGSRSKNPELEYVSSYDTFPYFFEIIFFGSISTNPRQIVFLRLTAGSA